MCVKAVKKLIWSHSLIFTLSFDCCINNMLNLYNSNHISQLDNSLNLEDSSNSDNSQNEESSQENKFKLDARLFLEETKDEPTTCLIDNLNIDVHRDKLEIPQKSF